MANKTIQVRGNGSPDLYPLVLIDILGDGTQYALASATPSGLASSVAPDKGNRTFSTAAPTNAAAQALAANTSRKEALIYNNGTMTVYLGKDNTITTSNGLPLPPGASLRDDRSTGAWFAITAGGTGDLRIVEVA